jgi:hypothetical protein
MMFMLAPCIIATGGTGEVRTFMTESPTPADLRRWGLRCAAKAERAKDEPERERLLQMKKALFELAETREWLEQRNKGRVPPDAPPAA